VSARRAIIAEMVTQIGQSAGYAPLYFSPEVVAYNKDVTGYVPAASGLENFSFLSVRP
jgi:peptide/nickel transport system substrate-binding protein